MEAFGSDGEPGLSEAEAHRRLQQHGASSITSRGGKPGWLKFLLQFNNPLLITLLLVGSVKLALGKPRDAMDGRRGGDGGPGRAGAGLRHRPGRSGPRPA